MWLRSRRASVPAIPPPVHDDDDVHRYFREIVLPSLETWVIDSDDDNEESSIAAALVLNDAWIDHLYVDVGRTGHRLGTRLIDLAKARRPDGLDLWTFAANTRARRFYEGHGFHAIASTDGDNEEGAPDVRYRWTPVEPSQ